jgi:hypothetical protein
MKELSELRKLAFELNSFDNTEVVKTAGVLRKLKNFFKRLINTKYKDEADQLKSETIGAKETIAELEKKFQELSKAIADADVESYKILLGEVKELIRSFWIEFNLVEESANALWYTSIQEMKEPKFDERFKKNLPAGYDIELGKVYRTPIKGFSWYKDLTANSIYIRTGEGLNTITILFRELKKKLVSSGAMDELAATEYLKIEANKTGIVNAMKEAIANGTLIEVRAHTPHEKAPNVPIGQTDVFVASLPFTIPNTSITIQVGAELIDFKTSVRPKDKISLKKLTYLEIISLAATRFDMIKLAGVDFNAYKSLPDSFWKEFVNVSKRIGAKPEDLASIVYSESAFDPKATNIQHGVIVAKGLNQFIKSTAAAMGINDNEWENYQNLSAEQQLKYIEKYFRGVGKQTGVNGWGSATHLYVANFAPKYTGMYNKPNFVIHGKTLENGKPNPAYYKNSGLDKEKKGFITVNDLTTFVHGKLPQEIKDKLKKAEVSEGYTPVEDKSSQPELSQTKENDVGDLLGQLFSDSSGALSSIVKDSLNTPNEYLIKINSDSDFINKLEYARVAANILRKYAKSEVSICGSKNKNIVEISCIVEGNTDLSRKAVKELCKLVADRMSLLMKKYGKTVNIKIAVLPEFISEYDEVDSVELINNNRKFNFARIGQ